MKFSINPLAAISMLLLPLSALAAPATEPTTPDLAERGLDPKINCYKGGQVWSDIGTNRFVVDKVRQACNRFKTNEGATFTKGVLWATCIDIPAAGRAQAPQRINMSMRYKGLDNQWIAKSSLNVGGLAEYCFTAMRSTLAQCKHGGSFENHRLGSDGRWQWWDVVLDPNSGQC